MGKYKLKNLDLVNTSFLLLTPVLMVVFISLHLVYEDFSWGALLVGFVFYLLTGFSITVGYHRLFSHKAFKTNRFIQLLLLIFGAATFQNSLLKWASDHRHHHSKVDTPEDPYNINEGFFYAHMGWILLKREIPLENVNDLKADPLIMWQHNNYIYICSFFGLVLPALLGWYFGTLWAGIGIAALGRTVLVHHATFFINSLCHYIGKQTYSESHTSKDSVIMALLTFGEGYHNFHHEFQIDYRNGIRWYHFDPTKWVINILTKLGLAWDLKTAPEADILKAALVMQEKRLANRENIATLRPLREALVAKRSAIEKLKKEYKSLKERELKQEFLQQIKLKQREFKEGFAQWKQTYAQMQLQLA